MKGAGHRASFNTRPAKAHPEKAWNRHQPLAPIADEGEVFSITCLKMPAAGKPETAAPLPQSDKIIMRSPCSIPAPMMSRMAHSCPTAASSLLVRIGAKYPQAASKNCKAGRFTAQGRITPSGTPAQHVTIPFCINLKMKVIGGSKAQNHLREASCAAKRRQPA
eukprot:CAMPEP_0181400834 /NCGR_PEP_ID=MMETSP1110-20121109/2317_1 /TAXON_ID=174948 /ORGANISM="Symbiodinium sp., Strain CCMP421" /LENGTH=163 /DNA_ID=CAMNT_0023522941 /DNA_START=28 /DNA_END=519 /DNA_ORIENTATION=+